MFGEPGGHPNALRPVCGVAFKLVDPDNPSDEDPSEGELVLLKNGSTTSGYLTLSRPDPLMAPTTAETIICTFASSRSLTGGVPDVTPQQRFHTNDRFRRILVDGKEWIE